MKNSLSETVDNCVSFLAMYLRNRGVPSRLYFSINDSQQDSKMGSNTSNCSTLNDVSVLNCRLLVRAFW